MLRYPIGKGYLYLCSAPRLFSNYNLLDGERADLAWAILSQLPDRTTIVDNSYMAHWENDNPEKGPLSYILEEPALKWSYYLVLFTVFLAAIFLGKRRQRVVRVLERPRNTTAEFVETIGRLYFSRNAVAPVAKRRAQFFLNAVRRHFQLNIDQLDVDFLRRLQEKSDLPAEKTEALLRNIIRANNDKMHREADLLTLNAQLEEFYTQSGIYNERTERKQLEPQSNLKA
jgi:hypothetical protein